MIQFNQLLIVAGEFYHAGGVTRPGIASWNSTTWGTYGTPIGPLSPNTEVNSLINYRGRITIGGRFPTAGGVPVNRLASWTGTTWVGFGTGVDQPVTHLAVSPSGTDELFLSGSFRIAGGNVSAITARWTPNGQASIGTQPASQDLICHESAFLRSVVSSGYGADIVRWYQEYLPIPAGWRLLSDGPLDVNGQIVGEISGTQTAELSLLATADFGSSRFRAVFFNPCGQVTSIPATIAITNCPLCDADVNCDNALNGFDVEVMERAVGGDDADYCRSDPDFNGDHALNGFDVESVEIAVGSGCQ